MEHCVSTGMNSFRTIGRSLSRWASILALLLLAAGSAAHFGHHLLDPDCDSRPNHATCASCSALHGGLTEATMTEAPALGVPEAPLVLAAVAAEPQFALPRVTSPRAPPRA
jgi:hypothetical protein